MKGIFVTVKAADTAQTVTNIFGFRLMKLLYHKVLTVGMFRIVPCVLLGLPGQTSFPAICVSAFPACFAGFRGFTFFRIGQGCSGLSVHKGAGKVDTDPVGKRAERLIRLFELFAPAGSRFTSLPPRRGSMMTTGMPFAAAAFTPSTPAWETSSR